MNVPSFSTPKININAEEGDLNEQTFVTALIRKEGEAGPQAQWLSRVRSTSAAWLPLPGAHRHPSSVTAHAVVAHVQNEEDWQ